MFRIFAFVFLGLSSLLAAAPQKQQPGHKPNQQSKPAPVQPSASSAPAAQQPATLEHEPSSPPEVSFQNGQLTIVARNSTMGDILNAVRQKTGASVETPGTSSERVVGQFGPGAPRDVMAQLLNGSHYDYVLLGSPSNPGALKKVVLMARASGPEPAPQPQPQNQQSFQDNENLQAVPDVENEPPPDENSVEVPQEVPQEEEQSQPDQQGQQQGAPVVKTPEQLLRELQQQQQQQQQEQPPPGAPGAPPQ